MLNNPVISTDGYSAFSQPKARAAHSDQDVPLPADGYNFILFFSLPFDPLAKMYKKKWSFGGHLSLSLGDNVYQLHDPRKLHSKFLVSKMPLTSWLFEDGPWHDWDPSSKYYRHIHLYEKAEIKRTVVFYAALKNFPRPRQLLYENYFEKIERQFQRGRHNFNMLRNNCTDAINTICCREGWLNKTPLDFFPAVTYKKLVKSWQRQGRDATFGHIDKVVKNRFKLKKICLGVFSFSPAKSLKKFTKPQNS